MPDPPEPRPRISDVLSEVRDETILTTMVAVMHWRVADSASRELEELHWIVHLAALVEPEVEAKAREVMLHISEDAKVLAKLEEEHSESGVSWSTIKRRACGFPTPR